MEEHKLELQGPAQVRSSFEVGVITELTDENEARIRFEPGPDSVKYPGGWYYQNGLIALPAKHVESRPMTVAIPTDLQEGLADFCQRNELSQDVAVERFLRMCLYKFTWRD